MKKFLLLPFFLALSATGTAQTSAGRDVLHKTDRSTLEGRIDEVGDVNVFYFPASAPTIRRMIARRLLWKIVFADGTTEVLNQPQAASDAPQSEAANAVAPTPPPMQNPPAATPARPTLSRADWLRAGSRALSVGVGFSGNSTKTVNRLNTTKSSESGQSLTVVFQHFLRDNLTLGASIAYARSVETDARQSQSIAPVLSVGGHARQFLPLGSEVALFGYGTVAFTQGWYRGKVRDGNPVTYGTLQNFTVGLGAGAAYRFAPGWSLDVLAALLVGTFNTEKDSSPGARPISVIGLAGENQLSSFNVLLTRYF